MAKAMKKAGAVTSAKRAPSSTNTGSEKTAITGRLIKKRRRTAQAAPRNYGDASKPVATLPIDKRRLKIRDKVKTHLIRLSPAERAVYDLMIQGKSAAAIAADLDRSTFTISNHTRKIFEAFGVTSRTAIIAMLVVPIDAEATPL